MNAGCGCAAIVPSIHPACSRIIHLMLERRLPVPAAMMHHGVHFMISIYFSTRSDRSVLAVGLRDHQSLGAVGFHESRIGEDDDQWTDLSGFHERIECSCDRAHVSLTAKTRMSGAMEGPQSCSRKSSWRRLVGKGVSGWVAGHFVFSLVFRYADADDSVEERTSP